MKQDTNPLYSDLKIRHDCVFPNVKMTVEAEYQYSLGLGAHYHNETSECNRTIIVKKTNRGINRIEWQQPWAEFDKRTKSRQIQFGQIRFEYEFDPPENHVIKYKDHLVHKMSFDGTPYYTPRGACDKKYYEKYFNQL